jgi:hypothetical protein
MNQEKPLACIYGRRMSFYQYFNVLGSGFRHLFELKNIR